ncbi:hypothetical protein MKK75_17660 [Methylobacterium sp. J-030]|uniref:hypothetical protein n=1 Tax=Methylobacterium sp. J-030 TaxID=2836627 RepID=UPI001FBBD784|nr:hypothetical protein [Methylobacterium sp. J-030]MCJ2070599.1 hypothetical protein [Methylobacterium sp. J-030]
MDIGSLVSLAILLPCAIAGFDYIFIAAICFLAFGALAALPPSLTMGVTITAANLGFGLLILRSLITMRANAFLAIMLPFNKCGLLTLFMLQAMLCTAIFPWVFEGQTIVYPLRGSGDVLYTVSLSPSMSNITQFLYLLESYLLTIVIAARFQTTDFLQVIKLALYLLLFILFITACLDILSLNFILDVFRNANYSLVGETNIGLTKRVVGAMPEASSFGALTASLFAILLLMRRNFGMDYRWVFATLGSLLLACLSTSSTAYAILAAAGAAFALQTLIRVFVSGRIEQERSAAEIIVIFVLAILAVEAIISAPEFRERISFLLNALVFEKTSTSSFEERTRWSNTAFEALQDSHWLGIGVGSARTSNGLINILASTGLLGAVFFVAFNLSILSHRRRNAGFSENYSAVLALVPMFVGFALSSPTADFGSLVALLFALQIRSG